MNKVFNAQTGLPRRDFFKLSAAATLGLTLSRFPAMAGPFTREDFARLVPADKKLSADWVKSLFARGEPEVLRGSELRFVGMPVGGIGAGQLYLGGDGRLLHWDIFNQSRPTNEAHYAHPFVPAAPLAQGFALRLRTGDQIQSRRLQAGDWREITFRGEYPVGRVEYQSDPVFPVGVTLEAFSPFIPLSTEDSSLPATVLEFTLRNSGAEKVAVELCGWLENAVGLRSAAGVTGQRLNEIIRGQKLWKLNCSAQANSPAEAPFAQAADFGTLTLALLAPAAGGFTNPAVALEDLFSAANSGDSASRPLAEKLIGLLGRRVELKPGESAKITFVLAWHFPHLALPTLGRVGRHYAARFASAGAVADYLADNFDRLAGQTQLWRDTWYDSTLPFWFLDRTFLNASILATSTCYRLANGRFYGWEGVGCCAGTCGHVYHYAHAAARLFPDLERDVRERVDFGLALQADGAIRFRGEFNHFPAVDAQAGTILRALREHQMCVDDQFLRRNWPKIKLAMRWLINKDENGDGLIESNQHNTLDSDWYGKVAWLSGLYLAALTAAAAMADATGDEAFAAECRKIASVGRNNFVEQLFDGEYFINRVDPKHGEAINSGTGCEIDQVFGQSWALQVGLPRVLPEKETVSALKSLWRYNFSPDVGPYRAANPPGRWYAMPGEAGVLMCTFPRRDWDFQKACGVGSKRPGFAGYFNECMNGFEHQVAGHMLWEGLVLEGLAVERAVHDRYHASRRNPWNEIECGDHYARSMASYGVYLAACGFTYDGPKGDLGFAPKLAPENFKCAFTAAEGWGSYAQRIESGTLTAQIAVRWGKLRLKTLTLAGAPGKFVRVALGATKVPAKVTAADKPVSIAMEHPIEVKAGETLEIVVI